VTDGAAAPDLATFRELARGRRVIPVTRRLLADEETPVGLYRKLAGGRPGTFLLESAEHGRVWSRYSFVGARSRATLTERVGGACWLGDPPSGVPTGGDPLEAVRGTLDALHTPRLPGLPPLTGGLVGYIGYDAVRRLERLPTRATDDLRLPELTLLLATDLAALDHADGSVLLIANAFPPERPDGATAAAALLEEAYADALRRLDRMTGELTTPAAPSIATYDAHPLPPHHSRTERADYLAAVEHAKEEIRAGEAFQVVLSQRFERRTTAPARSAG